MLHYVKEVCVLGWRVEMLKFRVDDLHAPSSWPLGRVKRHGRLLQPTWPQSPNLHHVPVLPSHPVEPLHPLSHTNTHTLTYSHTHRERSNRILDLYNKMLPLEEDAWLSDLHKRMWNGLSAHLFVNYHRRTDCLPITVDALSCKRANIITDQIQLQLVWKLNQENISIGLLFKIDMNYLRNTKSAFGFHAVMWQI